MRLDTVDRLLADLEERIDEKKAMANREKNYKALHFEPLDAPPMFFFYNLPAEEFRYPHEEAYYDPEKMLYNELVHSFGSIRNSIEVGDDFLYQIRNNHGCVQIASLFGGKVSVSGNCGWIAPISVEEIDKVMDKGQVDFKAGLGARIIDTIEYFKERLSAYPKCARTIAITQPDLQGPFDIAHLLVGPELLYLLYDEPEWVHKLLSFLSDTYIDFTKLVNAHHTGFVHGDTQIVHGSLCKGPVIIKDDTATAMLSGEMYEEFATPYYKRVFEALGGGSLHYCGKPVSWHKEKILLSGPEGINLGQPQFHDIADVQKNYLDKKVPMLGWGFDREPEVLESFYADGRKITTGLSVSCCVSSVDEAKRVYERHREHYMK